LTVAFVFGLAHEATVASGVGEAGVPALAPALAATLSVADAVPPEADGLEAEPHAARTAPHRTNPASWVDRLRRLMFGNPQRPSQRDTSMLKTQRIAHCDANTRPCRYARQMLRAARADRQYLNRDAAGGLVITTGGLGWTVLLSEFVTRFTLRAPFDGAVVVLLAVAQSS